MDEGTIVLLEPLGIVNDLQWRQHFSGQLFGYGIRTESRKLEQEDLALVKQLLSDPASWSMGEKACDILGDAAIVLRGPSREIEVLLELWCGRAWIRVSSSVFCAQYRGNIDAVQEDLLKLAMRYFEGDEYLSEWAERLSHKRRG